MVLVALAVIVTLNSLLIEIVDFVRSTVETNCFGRGVYRVLSVEDWNREPRTLKSEGVMLEVGRPPSLISDTVVMPEMIILLESEIC